MPIILAIAGLSLDLLQLVAMFLVQLSRLSGPILAFLLFGLLPAVLVYRTLR
jgi:hypothetical protein